MINEAKTAEHIIQYIFLLLPGIISVKIYHAFCPIKKESDLFEIANSVFQSVLILTIYIILSKKSVDEILSIKSFKIIELLLLLGIGILWGVCLILIKHSRIAIANKFKLLKVVRPSNYSVWERINHDSKNEWAIVFLDDNTIYRGYISLATIDPAEESNDFLISKAARVNEKLKVLYNIDGKGVYIKMGNVKKIEFCK